MAVLLLGGVKAHQCSGLYCLYMLVALDYLLFGWWVAELVTVVGRMTVSTINSAGVETGYCQVGDAAQVCGCCESNCSVGPEMGH